MRGLANAHAFPDIAPRIQGAITRWLGWYWDDPYQGLILGRVDLTSEDSRKRQTRTRYNEAAWQAFSDLPAFPAVARLASGDASWLCHRVLGILSFLPHAAFAEALTAWSVSRAIMGMPRHTDELSWALRINDADAIEAHIMVIAVAERLAATSLQILHEAARWLLNALGTIDATARHDALAGLAAPSAPADSNWFDADILDPARSPIAAEDSSGELMRERIGGVIDLRFKANSDLLTSARLDPERFRRLLGELALGAVNLGRDGLQALVAQLSSYLPVLNADERSSLEQAIVKALATPAEPSGEDVPWRARLLEIRLLVAADDQQVDLVLRERPSRSRSRPRPEALPRAESGGAGGSP